ncbi:MAG: dihydroorotate dehydrogenase-like protein [Spirochaetales bacterium]
MANLQVQYLGKTLPTPFIVSSSSLTQSVESIRKCEEAGAGAVVLKSLFEEQIEADIKKEEYEGLSQMHPEAHEYFDQMGRHLGPSDYLKLIESAKKVVKIPVFASLNCVSEPWWIRYAEQLATAGADGIELNLSRMPRDPAETAQMVEDRLVHIVETVVQKVSLPIAAKIGPYFTSLPNMVHRMERAGVKGLVLFNRFYQLDIDPQTLRLAPGYQFSTPQEVYTSLRWISILSGQVECDLSASTGVHDGITAVKLLLAGASSVQVCSVLYRKGIGELRNLLKGIETWMEEKQFTSIDEFKGKLSQTESTEPETYERLQYVKALTGIS